MRNDTRFYGARLTLINSSLWELKYKDGRIWRFTPNGVLFFLSEQRDTNGNSVQITRNASGHVSSVRGDTRTLSFAYGANGFVSQITDPLGRSMTYTYNAQNRIATVTGPDTGVTSYTYSNDTEFPATVCPNIPGGERLKTIQRPGQTAVQTLYYGPGRRVLREVLEDGSENKFAYKLSGACVTHVSNPGVKCTANCPDTDSWDNFQAGWRISGGSVVQTTFTDANGKAISQRFNGTGLGSQQTNAQGQATQYVRDAQNQITQVTDPLGRTWRYQYDAKGNRTQAVDPLNRVTDTTYDATWNKPTTITRYLNGQPIVTRYEYDAANGNLLKAIDPRLQETHFTYTAQGQLSTVRNVALNQTTTFEYNGAGDLIKVRDSLGNETDLIPDAIGRTTKTIDPLGFGTATDYNTLDQVTKITDAAQGLTQFGFDTRRDLRSVTNPLNRVIEAYEYDGRRRLVKKTDAKLKDEFYTYDANGNLKTVTDRRGQVTTFTYDEQNRIVRIEFPGGATQSRGYDVVGRLIEVREPESVIGYSYDAVDRLVKETADSVAGRTEALYEYDALDRRTKRSVLVNGLLAEETTYAYDDANRLTTQTHRAPGVGQLVAQTVSYVWDDGNRLTQKTLPNGIKQVLAYDGANRVLEIAYRNPNDSPIESVAYTYDANGQRLTRATSSSGVSETGFSAAYDEANRMTNLTLTAIGQSFVLAYDDNGNLASKTEQGGAGSVTTYTWDSRNRLTAISAPGITASFTYDGLGRRVSRTVNGQTLAYAYDGMQAVGEIVNGQVSATLLTGLSLDEVIARYTSAGARTYLVDALNSVLAQAREDRAIQNSYAYSPYGQSVTLGPDGGNPIQYTGRENDGTGLLYYRARYYDPALKRFISEDPIGIAGGLNVAAYVSGNPISFNDPLGLIPFCKSLILGVSQNSYQDVVETILWMQRFYAPGTPTPSAGPPLLPPRPGFPPVAPKPDFDWIPYDLQFLRQDIYQVDEIIRNLLVICTDIEKDSCGRATEVTNSYNRTEKDKTRKLLDTRRLFRITRPDASGPSQF